MEYLPHTQEDIKTMMATVGINSWEDLFAEIPTELRLHKPLELPQALDETALVEYFQKLAADCATFAGGSFLGAGAYRHFIPSAVEAIISRSEFLTAYTPYQAEASQGTLQTIFEFQTMICRLTGLDVANASVYDGGTAAVDGVLMACAQTRKNKVLVSRGVNPQVRQILRTYLASSPITIEEIPLNDKGQTDLQEVAKDVGGVLLQNPNFLGVIEDGVALCSKVHAGGAAAVVSVADPVSLALLQAPGRYGADICCGDAQGLGNNLAYGGPYVGFLACTNKYLRRIPGRLVGMTDDKDGKRGYCLTLQAREQHIRREKASSNICSNQALCALATTIYLSLLGPQGLYSVAKSCVQNTQYLRNGLKALKGVEIVYNSPVFNEFVIKLPAGKAEELQSFLASKGIQGGYLLEKDYPQLADSMLLCCTELCRAKEIDNLLVNIKDFLEGLSD